MITKTYIIQLHNEYSWDEDYTIDDVKERIEGYNCSPECEGVGFTIDSIKEFSAE